MTREQYDSMLYEIVTGTMGELSRIEKISVLMTCVSMVTYEPEYPTRVPIDTDNLAEPF